MALVPVYINELSPKDIVGIFGVYTQLFAMLGLVTVFGFGVILTKSGVEYQVLWRVMFGLDILPICIVIVSCFLGIIPESPNSLIMKE
jgi:MFS family permease